MSLHFEPVWSWTLTLLVAAAVAFVMRLGYPRRIAHLSAGWKRLLLLLRLASAALLFLLLLRPVVVIRSASDSDAILYILADSSRSTQTEDEPGGGSRRQAILKLLREAEPALERLREKVEIRIRDFADDIQTVEFPGENADGPMTAFGAVLQKTAEEIGRSRVPAVLLLSDGRQAASGSLDSDPLIPARQFGRQQRPIYTVGFGSAQATGSSLDLALEDLDLSREVFQGNVLPVRVRLRAAGAQGQPVRVRVLLENRSGLVDGQSGEMVPVQAGDDNRPVVSVTPAGSTEEQTIQLQIVPSQTGDLKLAVEADPLPGEVRKTNNRVETIIRVRRGGIRVAYFDIVRSEQKWIKQINDSTRIQLDFHPIRSGRFRTLTRIPDRYFEPGVYDAFIIGDVPASVFTARQLQSLFDCCNLGAGLMMTGGRENFGAGGFGQSPLAALFSVELPGENPQLTIPLRMVPTRDGLAHYVMQIAAPDQNRARWDQLPPLTGANLLTLKPGRLAEVLAASETGSPLLIGESVGPARVLLFAGDTTWQWTMKGFAEEHKRFWRQVILWLTRKETDDDLPLWINANPRDLTPGRATELTFGVRDAQGMPVTGVTYEIKVTGPDGTTTPVAAVSGAGGDFANFEKTLVPGDYWARMQATKDGQLLPGIAVTRFHVNQRDPELDNPAADYALLREISHASGGELLTPEQLIERLNRWAADGLPGMALERQERRTLWDNWLMLLLIAGLMVTEWAVRKRRGLV